MAIAGTLEIQMLANMARLQSDMTQAKSMVGSSMKSIESAVASAKSALGALGIGLGVGYFVSLIKGSIDAADHLRDLSKSTNIAVGDLAGLKLLAKQTGTDLDGLANGILKMSVAMGKDPEKFKALGVTAKDNAGAFKQLADIFNLIPDIQQRNALSQAVFSKSWKDMAPALSEGGQRIGEIIEKGKHLSGITEEMTKAADDFNDKWAELTSTGGLLTRQIGPLLPILNALADDFIKVQNESDGLGKSFNPLAEAFRAAVILGGNVAFVMKAIGIEAGGLAAQLAALARGDFAGFTAIGATMKKDAAEARAAFDVWEQKMLTVGTVATDTGNKAGAAYGKMTDAQKKAAAAAAKFLDTQEKINKELQKFLELGQKNLSEHLDSEENMREVASKREVDDAKKTYEDLQRMLKIGEANQMAAIDSEEEMREIAQKREIETTVATAKKIADEQERINKEHGEIWKTIDQTAQQTFVSIFNSGKSAFDRLRDTLKNGLYALLYEMTLKKWLIQIAASVGGVGAATSAFGSSAVGSTLGTAAGVGVGAGLGSLAYANAVGMAGGDAMGALIAANSTGWGVSSATSILGAIPGVGWAAMAAVAVAAILSSDHGSPTSTTGDNTINFSSAGGILSQSSKYGGTTSATDAYIQSMQAGYAAAAKAMGIGIVGSTFAFAGNTGEDGKAPNFGLTGGAGNSIFTQGETPTSDAAIHLAAARAVFAALQGSDLPGYLSKLFDGLSAGSMTLEQINSVETFATQLKSVRDALTETRTPLQVLQDQVATGVQVLGTSAETFKKDFVAAIESGLTPETFAAWIQLGKTIDAVTASVEALNGVNGQVRNALRGISDQVAAFGQKVIDAAKGVQTANDAISQAYFDAQDQVNNLMRQAADNLDRFTTSIDDFLATLMPTQSLGALKAKLSSTAALAAGGDADAQSKLINIAKEVIKASEGASASAIENARNVAFVRSTLEGVKSTLTPEKSAATAAADDFATQLAAAKLRVVDLGLVMDAAKISTERATTSQISGVDLLNTYNTAIHESNVAQADWLRAEMITTGLILESADPMAALIASVSDLGDALAAGGKLPTNLGMSAAQAGELATKLGLSGIAATTFINAIIDPASGATALATKLGLSGAAASDFIRALITPLPAITSATSKFSDALTTNLSILQAAFADFKKYIDGLIGTVPTTVAPVPQTNAWNNGTYRGADNTIINHDTGTITAPSGASATYAQLTDVINDAKGYITSGSVTTDQVILASIGSAIANHVSSSSLNTIMAELGYPGMDANGYAVSHGLPSFAGGIGYVPYDMTARIHKGERVMTARDNQAANDDIVIELRELRSEVKALRSEAASTARSTGDTKLLLEQVAFAPGISLQTRAG